MGGSDLQPLTQEGALPQTSHYSRNQPTFSGRSFGNINILTRKFHLQKNLTPMKYPEFAQRFMYKDT